MPALVDGIPFVLAFRQPPPLAAVLRQVENDVQNLQVAEAHIAPMFGKEMPYSLVLLLGNFHTSTSLPGSLVPLSYYPPITPCLAHLYPIPPLLCQHALESK